MDNSARIFNERVSKQIENGGETGIAHTILAALIFTAFALEAKVNFVGWKVLEEGWPERAKLREKLDLLRHVLSLEFDWGERPLQTVKQLKALRDTLAHGKPEIENLSELLAEEPDVKEVLRAKWEQLVTVDFLNRCREDDEALWDALVGAAGISVWDATTKASQSLTIVKPN